jgi:hypothetical protein
MDNGVISQAESDEKILTFDVPDEALERAASAEQNALTMLYCTTDWYSCGLPQIVSATAPAAWRYSPRSDTLCQYRACPFLYL